MSYNWTMLKISNQIEASCCRTMVLDTIFEKSTLLMLLHTVGILIASRFDPFPKHLQVTQDCFALLLYKDDLRPITSELFQAPAQSILLLPVGLPDLAGRCRGC